MLFAGGGALLKMMLEGLRSIPSDGGAWQMTTLYYGDSLVSFFFLRSVTVLGSKNGQDPALAFHLFGEIFAPRRRLFYRKSDVERGTVEFKKGAKKEPQNIALLEIHSKPL